MKKMLFVTERWCDGNPDMGITNSSHNLFGSFERSNFVKDGEWEYKTIHFDEISLKGKHIDDFAQQIYDKTKPDIVLVTLLGTMSCNPTGKFFEVFKKAGCKIVFLWPDFGKGWTIESAKRFDKFIDLNVSIACEETFKNDKVFWSWTPEDSDLFKFEGFENKQFDICFLGTVHSQERQDFLKVIQEKFKNRNIYLGGGQRKEKLSHEKYAELTRRSKIIINFPFSPVGQNQVKGRIFESTSCGCLLFERKNSKTPKFFEPNKEYVEYEDEKDLLEKLNYYLDNKEEREKISLAGLKKFDEKWNHNKFWEELLKRVG